MVEMFCWRLYSQTLAYACLGCKHKVGNSFNAQMHYTIVPKNTFLPKRVLLHALKTQINVNIHDYATYKCLYGGLCNPIMLKTPILKC